MKKTVLLIIILFLLMIPVFAPISKNIKEFNQTTITQMRLSELRISTFSPENLYRYLILINADHKEIIMKQAILETGYFKSRLFKQNCNLFGMKMPKRRTTTAIGSNHGFAAYYHWTRSVDDYIVLQQSWKIKLLKFYNDGYEVLILAKYAENPKYIEILKHIKILSYGDNTSDREGISV